MRTRIDYLTTDQVNHSLAEQMARECGSPLVRTPAGGVPPGGPLIAKLLDLDHVWPQQRQAILENLLSGPPSVAVAVHGYCLDEEQTRSLCANGVIVARSLDSGLFLRLRKASEPHQEPLPVEGDGDEIDDRAEPAALCTLVRSVAIQAHKALRGPAPIPSEERRELRRQLDRVQTQLDGLRRSHALRLEELERWLNRLLQLVEHHDHEESGLAEAVNPHVERLGPNT
jgi:hypothetical protein